MPPLTAFVRTQDIAPLDRPNVSEMSDPTPVGRPISETSQRTHDSAYPYPRFTLFRNTHSGCCHFFTLKLKSIYKPISKLWHVPASLFILSINSYLIYRIFLGGQVTKTDIYFDILDNCWWSAKLEWNHKYVVIKFRYYIFSDNSVDCLDTLALSCYILAFKFWEVRHLSPTYSRALGERRVGWPLAY